MGVEPEDTLKTKKALSDLGHYKIKSGLESFGITDFVDNEMFDGIKSFQKDNELKIDGIMHPGGPTERKINQSLMKKKHFDDPKQDKNLDRAQLRRERLEALRIKKPNTNKFDNPFELKGFNFSETAERPKTKPTTLFDGDKIKKEDQKTRGKNEPSNLKPTTQPQENKDKLTSNPPQTMSRKANVSKPSYDEDQVLKFESNGNDKLYHLTPYIPKNNQGTAHAKSGVTLGGGVDIGQIKITEFDDLAEAAGLDQTTRTQLASLVGLKGNDAKKKLDQIGELTLTKAQAEAFTKAKYKKIESELKKIYENNIKDSGLKNGRSYEQLSQEERTVLMSIAMNHGPAIKNMRKTVTYMYYEQYDKVIEELNNYYGPDADPLPGHIARRKAEAAYLIALYDRLKNAN